MVAEIAVPEIAKSEIPITFFAGKLKIKIKAGTIKNPPPNPTIEEIVPIAIPRGIKIKLKIPILPILIFVFYLKIIPLANYLEKLILKNLLKKASFSLAFFNFVKNLE